MSPKPRPPLERFNEHVTKQPNGCWTWNTGDVQTYTMFYDGVRRVYSHRWAYEQFVGPIPDGLEIDHVCRVRNCVNPAHLEAVTHRENMRRGTAWDFFRSRTTCPQGHPYDETNTYYRPSGGRQCRTCARLWQRVRDGARRAEKASA